MLEEDEDDDTFCILEQYSSLQELIADTLEESRKLSSSIKLWVPFVRSSISEWKEYVSLLEKQRLKDQQRLQQQLLQQQLPQQRHHNRSSNNDATQKDFNTQEKLIPEDEGEEGNGQGSNKGGLIGGMKSLHFGRKRGRMLAKMKRFSLSKRMNEEVKAAKQANAVGEKATNNKAVGLDGSWVNLSEDKEGEKEKEKEKEKEEKEKQKQREKEERERERERQKLREKEEQRQKEEQKQREKDENEIDDKEEEVEDSVEEEDEVVVFVVEFMWTISEGAEDANDRTLRAEEDVVGDNNNSELLFDKANVSVDRVPCNGGREGEEPLLPLLFLLPDGGESISKGLV